MAVKPNKNMKIYDCFNFFNELDILEMRLNILYDYVDYFVIVESSLTHSITKIIKIDSLNFRIK